ncbi:MAG: NAD(P)-binding protein [Lachnospiraceae bacterium]|nr:NAD(P)-binding protein [Lachnospiraceae bacterium]
MSKIYEFVIIGAGLAGLTCCKKLREKGVENLIVLEKNDAPGGLCTTKVIDGHILDVGGGHFFNSRFPDVLEYVFSHLPKDEFNYYERVSKVEIDGHTIDYPIESNVWQLPLEKRIDYLISIIRNGESLGKPEPQNFEEWIRWKLGDKVCEEYMIPYNEKLWGVMPQEMDVDWLYKIPNVNVREVLQYCLESRQDVTKFPAHIHFYYPKKGGFGCIVDAIAKDEMPFIKCNTKVTLLERRDDLWLINGELQAKNVINTTPWNDLFCALGSPEELREDFSRIRYNRIVVSLYETEYDVNWHWRYVPDKRKPFHREFYISNFAQASKKGGMYLETGEGRFIDNTVQINGASSKGDFITDAAYPIPVLGHKQAITNILTYFRPLRLFGVGRWGQHEYQNADVSMHEAIQFVEQLER